MPLGEMSFPPHTSGRLHDQPPRQIRAADACR